MDSRIQTLRTETASLMTSAKSQRSILSSITSTLSTTDMLSSISALEVEKEEIEKRLEELRGGNMVVVGQEEGESVEREWRAWKGIEERRKKIVVEIWRAIEGVVEKEGRAELRERLGLDE